MLKLTLSTIVVFLLLSKINAQEVNQIKSWQQQHPKVVFMSNDSYQLLSPEERIVLEKKSVIFFNGEISMEDIYAYESASLEKINISISNEAQYIKLWISNNPDVKTIKNASFQSASPSLKAEYSACAYCMVLNGEEISISDIESFEQEKH